METGTRGAVASLYNIFCVLNLGGMVSCHGDVCVAMETTRQGFVGRWAVKRIVVTILLRYRMLLKYFATI